MKYFLTLLALPTILFAQYFGERTTEQSFEQSTLYFNSHLLNTFGIYKFKDAAPGFINDPFLNAYINPANIPDIGDKEIYFHLDFRGDRTEPELLQVYTMPAYYDLASSYRRIGIDRRWFSETRDESEPIVSLGIITYPFGKEYDELYIGGSYQLVYSEDKFYQMPYSIYSRNMYLDAFNSRTEMGGTIPVEDRYYGKDEMINEAHLISAFSGYRLSNKLSFGIMINSVIHSRDGGYASINNDEYGDTDNSEWENSSITERDQTYDHFDVSGAFSFTPDEFSSIGIKAGMLTGNADQDYLSQSSSLYRNNEPNVSSEWNYNISKYSNIQTWQQDGNVYYGSVNFSKRFKKGIALNIYYRHTSGDIDTKTTSVIDDTSAYTNRWYNSYDNKFSEYNGHSALQDNRRSSGERNINRHELNFNINLKLNDITDVTAGIYYKRDFNEVSTVEPVAVRRSSYHYNDNSYQGMPVTNTITESESKNLHWDYAARSWTLQIPLLLNFNFNKHWGMMFGVNRILNVWKIEDVTTAIFQYRKRIENGVRTEEINFGERYSQPDERTSDDYFDIITSFHINISDNFTTRLILDPEFENTFRIDQWWLSFNAGF